MWNDTARGSVPLGWAVNPSSTRRFPPAFAMMFETLTAADVLTTGDSGAGCVLQCCDVLCVRCVRVRVCGACVRVCVTRHPLLHCVSRVPATSIQRNCFRHASSLSSRRVLPCGPSGARRSTAALT